VRIHAEMRALEQAYKTYCAVTGVSASDGEGICHAGFGMFFRSRKYLEQKSTWQCWTAYNCLYCLSVHINLLAPELFFF